MRDEALHRDPADAQALAVSGFLAYRFEHNPALAARFDPQRRTALRISPNTFAIRENTLN